MAKRKDINKILVIGSGPIVIGQGAEFDYAGTQACLTLRNEGYEVVLINSNPATIMSDTSVADKVYLEPLDLEFVKTVIIKERPDAVLGSLGGQTALNLVVELANCGWLEKYNVEILGSSLQAIEESEDRELFRNLMQKLEQPIPESTIVTTVAEAVAFGEATGYPLIIRPAFTLGGSGGGIAADETELKAICANGLKQSPKHQCLIEQSIAGWKEIEYEVMRDQNNNAIVVCNMENIDPVGIHTGDSIVVAPSLTISDQSHQMLRDASLTIIRALKINGGCNVQLALHPDGEQYCVIEVNPRVSRSSALASKATGYPIAKIASLIAVGYSLDEILNPITKTTYASFEPTLDYVVCKFPRFAFDKFTTANRTLSTQMKATGEVMAIGRNFESSLLKAICSLELSCNHLELKTMKHMDVDALVVKMLKQDDERIFAVAELMRRNYSLETLHEQTKITMFFLQKMKHIIDLEQRLIANPSDRQTLRMVKRYGFSDEYIAMLTGQKEAAVREQRFAQGILPTYKMVDTCGGEFEASTPYYYSCYEQENESAPSDKKKVIVLGSGPIRIGQGIEFDYASVRCVEQIKALGYEAIVINNNPETLSTDFSISDKLYFEPLTLEYVLNVCDVEQPLGVICQFGGQTAINLAPGLVANNIQILGTSLESIDLAEDRNQFEAMLQSLAIPQPQGTTAKTLAEVKKAADAMEYPLLLRPSFVLGGRAMKIVDNEADLLFYAQEIFEQVNNEPLLVDRYLSGKEVEVDAISDGKHVFIPGIMEHIEKAGVHSGDSISVYPPFSLNQIVIDKIIKYTQQIGTSFQFVGLFNIQFIVDRNDVYVLEVNPRASRSVPFLSKVTKVDITDIATRVIMGEDLLDMGYAGRVNANSSQYFVKVPVFSFAKLSEVDPSLGPEMKSTGEAIGMDTTLPKALYKGMLASGVKISLNGKILLTLADKDKEDGLKIAKRFARLGFDIYATAGTASFLQEHGIAVLETKKVNESEKDNLTNLIRSSEVSYIINTISAKAKSFSDGFVIRRAAVENGIPCFTSLDTAGAMVSLIESQSFTLASIDEWE
ncbi:MAG: carbamoyl-phosphate synthase large subunit [Erysipelotrichaceae bacterium]